MPDKGEDESWRERQTNTHTQTDRQRHRHSDRQTETKTYTQPHWATQTKEVNTTALQTCIYRYTDKTKSKTGRQTDSQKRGRYNSQADLLQRLARAGRQSITQPAKHHRKQAWYADRHSCWKLQLLLMMTTVSTDDDDADDDAQQ